MSSIQSALTAIDSFIWGPPLLILLVGTGIYLTLRLGLLQVVRLPLALRLVFGRDQGQGKQGDVSSWLFVLVKGEAEMVVNVEGRELKLGTLNAGDFFGELSLLTGEPSSFTVRAVATVETYRINQAMFQELVMQREALVEPLYRVLSDRQQEQRALLEREAEAMKQPPQQLDLLDKLMKLFGGR